MSILIPLLLSLAPAPAQEPAAAPEIRQASEPVFAEGQLIVRFERPTTIVEAAALLEGQPFAVHEALMPQLDMYLVLIADGASLDEAIERLEALPAVMYAVPDAKVEQRQTIPDDTLFSSLWGMHNPGQGGGTADADIDAPEAWDLGTGSRDHVIAIVDGGAQHAHTDLLANRWENDAEVNGTGGVDDDGNGYVDDKYGWNAYSNNGNIPSDSHGTHVAGIAGARGDNAKGVAGVNWDCEIMHVAGASGTTSTVLKAYTYVLTQRDLWVSSGGAKGANVVSCNSSFGIDFADCNTPTYKPWNDAYDLMGQSGILNAAATINGNYNVDVIGDVPTGCSSDWLIAVTNTDRNDNRASAGYGATTIDLGAPGTSVKSTVPNNSYADFSGTSMATPHVTGAVAFLHSVASPAFQSHWAAAPDQAALVLKGILLDSVDVIPSLNGKTVSDGRLNLHQAALAIQSWGCSGSVSTYCTAKVNSQGCTPAISASGTPSATSPSSFDIGAWNLINNKNGILFYGLNGPAGTPFQGGYLCATPPLKRTPVQSSGGNPPPDDCSGLLFLDFNAWIQGGSDPNLLPSVQVNAQVWYRDPASASTTGLTDAVEFTICN